MEFKGTKGEWDWEENSASQVDGSTCIEVHSGGGPQIAYLQSFVGWGADYERNAAIANANLIAAAPDLLEALQAIQAKMSDFIKLANEVGINDADGFYLAAATDAEEQARAAISKALGEE